MIFALAPLVLLAIATSGRREANDRTHGEAVTFPHRVWRRVNLYRGSPLGVRLSSRPDALQLKQCKDYRLPRCLLYTSRPFGLLTTPSG